MTTGLISAIEGTITRAVARGLDLFFRDREKPVPRMYTAAQMAEVLQLSRKTWQRLHERHEAALQRAGAYVDVGLAGKPSLRWDLDKTLTALQGKR